MAHALARGRRDASNKTDDGLFHVGFAPDGGLSFVRSANFANHDDSIGIRVIIEGAHHVDVLQAIDRITANADSAGLAQADFSQLRHGFIGQRTGTADHANAALAMDVAGHDADFYFFRCDKARAIGAQQQRTLATSSFFGFHAVAHFQHVAHRDAFGDADRQVQVGFNRFPNGCRSASGWHVNDRYRCTSGVGRIRHVGKNRDAFEIFARFFRVDACHKGFFAIGIVAAHAGVELPGFAGNALGDDFGVFVNVD